MNNNEKKVDLGSTELAETRELAVKLGEKAFRGDQVFQWIHQKQAVSFSEMTNIPAAFREKLEEKAFFQGAGIEKKAEDGDGTIKYLLELKNHNIMSNENILIETVYMDYRRGGSVCVSSQAGCRMGCAFCVSGSGGFTRNLTAGEMLAQVYTVIRVAGRTVSNVVIMGCGEPLDNYENTLKFIRMLGIPEGLGLGQRRITLSTCGITGKIYDLMKERLQITLAVSLHAPDDKLRRELMPAAVAYPIEGLLEACKAYGDTTKRRVTFEYAMIAGKNDSHAHAIELAGKIRGMLCHVNLIPVNGGSGRFAPSSSKTITEFKDTLLKNGINVTVRRTLGSSVSAACGQLRHSVVQSKNVNLRKGNRQ